MQTITKREQHMQPKSRKRVAAYARVSKENERALHSLSAQVSYYNDLIQKNPWWEYAGVYSDEAISGTGTEKRAGFQRLIEDCENGEVDIVLTKSISRFARNTVDLLENVRRLKDLGVEVRFERERINSLDSDGELMLTILASFAQAEVETMSQNIKWTIRKKFQSGQLNGCCSFLGYRWDDTQKKLVVIPEEAELVRRIFDMYLQGHSLNSITTTLNDEGISSKRGTIFHRRTISGILTNITYTGNLLLQKTYSADPLTKKERWNTGELPRYYAEGTHEAIIDMDTFEAVQARLSRMNEITNSECYETRGFTRKIVCGCCGRHYSRVKSKSKDFVNYYWKCSRRKEYGSSACNSTIFREDLLTKISCDVLDITEFDKDLFRDTVEKILVNGEDLEFIFYDGTRRVVQNAKCYSNTSED